MRAAWRRGVAVLRQSARATITLALLAGLVAGIAMSLWAAARRGDSTLDRFLTHRGPTTAVTTFCPPGSTSIPFDVQCADYDPIEEATAIRRLPGVTGVTRAVFLFGRYTKGDQAIEGVLAVRLGGGDMPTTQGAPPVVDGRLADPDSASDIVVTEEIAGLFELDVGDRLSFTSGQKTPLEVAGILRTAQDLLAHLDPSAAPFAGSYPEAGPGWWDRYGRQAAQESIGVFARVTARNLDTFESQVKERFPDRPVNVDVYDDSHMATVDHAIDYETTAITIVALSATAAWLFLVGQALVRQSLAENTDAAILTALGMTRGQRVAAAVIRALPLAVFSVLLAGGLMVLASSETPLGLAGRLQVDSGAEVDVLVLLVGGTLFGIATIALLCWGAVRGVPRARHTLAPKHFLPARTGSAVVVCSRGLGGAQARRSLPLLLAGATATVAVALGVAGTGLIASFRALEDDPSGYGAPWDAVVVGDEAFLSTGQQEAAVGAVRSAPGVLAAVGVTFEDARVADQFVPVAGFWTVVGPDRPWPRITAGRAPRTRGEIALGPKTMRELDVGLGERVPVSVADEKPTVLRVVGEVLLYDGFQIQPGGGAVIDEQWFGPGSSLVPDMLVLDGRGPTPDWSSIEDAGFTVVETPAPRAVRDLLRVDGALAVSIAVVALLAMAASWHAAATLARTERRHLAALRAVGMVRSQLAAVVGLVVLPLLVLAGLIGVAAGLAAEGWAWWALERRIGFDRPWAFGWSGIVGYAVAAPLTTALCAALGWWASRTPPARFLRTE